MHVSEAYIKKFGVCVSRLYASTGNYSLIGLRSLVVKLKPVITPHTWRSNLWDN